jgi:hypothetical protein
MKADRADFAGVVTAVRRMYATGTVDEPVVDLLDRHFARGLRALADAVGSVPGATAVLEPEVVRSHVLHVGLSVAPDWQAFNREYARQARAAAIRERDGEIVYWNILLSRIGPFWTDYWNGFRVVDGLARPVQIGAPESAGWTSIRREVANCLAWFGLKLVGGDLLGLRVSLSDEKDRSTSTGADQPTVYDALFSDV